MALNGLRLLYDVFFSLFGNTGLTHLDVAGGRTSGTGIPSDSAEASTPTVSRLLLGHNPIISLSRCSDCTMAGQWLPEKSKRNH